MFDLLAPFYDPAMRLLGASYSEAAALLQLHPGDLVVDVGGGTGLGARAAVAAVGCHVLIVDFNAAMLRHGRCDGCIGCVRGNAVQLPLPDASADGVMILDALHHFPQPERALAEVARVLKPSGRLAVLELEARHPATKVLALAERLAGEPGVMWTAQQLAAMLRQAGLSPLSIRGRGFGVMVTAARPNVM